MCLCVCVSEQGYKTLMKVFFDPLLCPMWSLWRPTQGKRDYVSNPSDTDQVARESKLALLACFEWVAEDMMKKGAANVDAKSVLDRWVDRAEDCSVAFMLLIWARFLLLLLSLEGTEATGDWRTYRLLLPCLHLLFCVANATNYVVLVSSETLFWSLASRAAHILQQKVGFVKKTRFGKLIFADRFVEWTVKNMRRFVGKRMVLGMDTQIQQTCINLDDLVTKEDNVAGAKSGGSGHRKVVKLQRPFWDTRRWLTHTNVLAAKGEPFYSTPSVNANGLRKRTEHKPGSMVTSDGKPMNPAFFNLLPEARKRSRAMNKAIFDKCVSVVVDLFVVRAAAKEASLDAEVRWVRDHAANATEIQRTFKGSAKRFLPDEEVRLEIEAALHHTDCPAWLAGEWQEPSKLRVHETAALLARVRTALFPDPPPKPKVSATVANIADDAIVRGYIQATLEHPLLHKF